MTVTKSMLDSVQRELLEKQTELKEMKEELKSVNDDIHKSTKTFRYKFIRHRESSIYRLIQVF